MFFLPLPDRKLASKGVFVIFIGLGFCPGCGGAPDKSGGSGGDGAPVSAAFLDAENVGPVGEGSVKVLR
mgnify:FL=1